MSLLTGNLLVASSLVTDPIFAGGVCLLVHQDENNVIGVMLNRPMQPSPDALAAMLDMPTGNADPNHRMPSLIDSGEMGPHNAAPSSSGKHLSDLSPTVPKSFSGMLHFGGPLSGPVVAIHQTSQYAEAETGTGIYVAAQKQHLENLLRDQSSPYRLIVGHLGWEWGQLDAEIKAGRWHIVPATAEAVFAPAAEMWPRLIRRATASSMARWIGVPDTIDAGELN